MKKERNLFAEDIKSTARQLLPGLLAAFPIYLAAAAYTKTFFYQDDEEAALGATVCGLAGLYTGRFLAQWWVSRTIPNGLFILLAGGCTACVVWLFIHAEFPLANRPYLNLLLFLLPLLLLSLSGGMLIKLSRISVQNQLRQARAAAEQSQSELHLLQSQLSPHFLFNTLNNLYGVSISQPEKTPALLLRLSDLLRYSVYEARELFVPLTEELAYLNNYIEFEKMRIGSRLALTTSLEAVSRTDVRIAPMLLIVFIENAFKHSKNTTEPRILIDIRLTVWGNSILFSVKNSFTKENPESSVLEKSGGLGLANVRRRLRLLYPDTHELTMQETDGFYQVHLQLPFK